jgi:DNA-binding transcriptional LysR family regulator
MTFMKETNSARADLNLLVVFDAIARTRSVTAAADQLSLSQPAVSHALKRLRVLMQDALFVRGRYGLVMTPHAKANAAEVKAILAAVGRVLARPVFEPASTTREFRLAGSDYAMMTLFPAMVAALRRQAPRSRIRVHNVDPTTPARIEAGEIDVAFYGVAGPSGPFGFRELFREHFVGLVCKQHSLADKARQGRITLNDYLEQPHVLAALPNDNQSPIDEHLARLGKVRRIALIGPNFAANVAAVRGTDLLVSVPSQLTVLPNCQDLVAFKLPLAMPDYPYLMAWHRSAEEDQATSWLREVVITIAKRLRPPRRAK